jgi:hypothetical protein
VKHSTVVGGSTAARMINCPGARKLIATVKVEDKGSDFAREGTMLHDVMERVIMNPKLLEDSDGQ